MHILKVEKICFKDRLKDLMRREHMSQEKLAEKMNVSKNTVTGWLNDVPLKRNRKEQLNKLGKIFDVDPEYIACEQAEEKNNFTECNSKIDVDKLGYKVKSLETMINLLDSIGVKYSSIPVNGTVERFNIIVDSVQYEVEDVLSSEYSVELSYKDRHAFLTDRDFQDFCNNQVDYLMYQVEKLFKAKNE